MPSLFSVIKDGVVDNVILADEAHMKKYFDNYIVYEGELPLGYTVKGNEAFIKTAIPLDEELFVDTSERNKTYIRFITRRAFMQRFTLQERTAIRSSVDPVIIDILEDLNSTFKVDLELPELEQALDYLIANNIIEAERKGEILVPGTQEEKYV